jgi:DNA-binding NtrC family response regulator
VLITTESALKNTKLLVVDDSHINRQLLKAIFGSAGCEVALAESGEQALPALTANTPDIVLLDLRMPGLDGIQTLQQLRPAAPNIPILVLTSYGDLEAAVKATSLGADDFISRPISNDDLVIRVAHAVEHRRLLDELEVLRTKLSEGQFIRRLMAPSAAMSAVVDSIRRVAKSNLTVLITGETGTGKEVVARAVHEESERRDKPFVAVDCGALPENIIESELFGYHKGAFTGADRQKPGYFDAAEGGTLFLDEVGNLPPATQIKLLRVIQERELRPLGTVQSSPLDVRLIAATNEKLEAHIPSTRFRADLYYRLAEFSISIPSLRERLEDVPMLARRLMQEAALELRRPICSVSPGAIEVLRAHSWPGNIRELRNVMRNAVVQCRGVVVESDNVRLALGLIERAKMAPELTVSPPTPLRKLRDAALAAIERKAIADALRYTKGNKAAAARLLEVDVKTLYAKLRLYDLDSKDGGRD